MKKELAEKILLETETGYDLIADKFSETRKNFWSELEFIQDYAKNEDKVLDFGCGNGRLLEIFSNKTIKYFGVDISGKLIEIAKGKYLGKDIAFQKLSSSSTLPRTKATNKKKNINSKVEAIEKEYSSEKISQRLVRGEPLSEGFFNTIYSIAVFHHLPSEDIRENTVKELFRVLQPDGKIVITVWNLWKRKYCKYILKNWLSKVRGKSDLDWNDCYVSFKNNKGQLFMRYHHAFTKKELEKTFVEAGFQMEKCWITGKNIVFVGKKTKKEDVYFD